MLQNKLDGGGPIRLSLLLVLLILVSPARSFAHEIPNDITIRVFIKPEGQRLRLLVRVPLRAMRDMEFPLLGPGYLDLSRADSELRKAASLWISNEVYLYENGNRLANPQLVAVLASIPSDKSFSIYEEALAHVTGVPLPESTQLYADQAMLDALIEFPIQSEHSNFSIDPNLDRLALRVLTVLHFLPPHGEDRVFEYTGDPGLIALDPGWSQAAFRFVALGFTHILDGIDHLLFLLCLVIPFRRLRPLVLLITAFTVGHSITLVAAAFGLAPDVLWFPPLVETLIAVSIVYMALENIVGTNLTRRWIITFGFGLVHGFGFSFTLHETLQFAGSHLVTSLLSFNVGVELGQLLVLVLFIPAMDGLFRYVVQERMGIIIVSALVAHTGWHWMTERGAKLFQYDVEWSLVNVTGLMTWLALALAFSTLGWWGSGFTRRRRIVKKV